MFFAMGALFSVAGVLVVPLPVEVDVVVVVAGALESVVVFLLFLAVAGCARAMATGENRRSRKSRRIEAGKRWWSDAVMCRITANFRIVRDKMGFSS
jgi:hypothetical protein